MTLSTALPQNPPAGIRIHHLSTARGGSKGGRMGQLPPFNFSAHFSKSYGDYIRTGHRTLAPLVRAQGAPHPLIISRI